MLVSTALTAATVCTAHACTKRLNETQWPETRDETYWAGTETYCSETEMRRIGSRQRLWGFCPRWDRDVSTVMSRDWDVSNETTSLILWQTTDIH